MGVPQMMRLSSISSQDSGFTSQDTLFLRPGSPGLRGKVRGGKTTPLGFTIEINGLFLIEAPLRLWPRPPPGAADSAPSPDGGGRRGQRQLQRPTRQCRRGQQRRPPPHHLGRVREGRRQAEAADRGQHLPTSRAAGGEEQPGMGKRNGLLSRNFDFRTIFFSQDDTASLHSAHHPPQPPPRPPVPQRCTSLDSSTSSLTSAAAAASANRPPSLPSGKKPFFGSLKKQQQQQVLQQQQQQQQLRQQQMPNFNAGKEDMGMFYLFTHFFGNCYEVIFFQLSPNLCT